MRTRSRTHLPAVCNPPACTASRRPSRSRRYDGNNDMQLTQECAKLEVPLAMHLGMLNANHWDMTYGSFPAAMALGSRKLNHQFPKRAALNAMIALAHELGFL
eukprot:6189657-Pleurochrysis_carterae.AAC.2